MSYTYGMKGAPVVGNGLGGLPRRAVAGAAAESSLITKYDLQHVTTFPSNGMPSSVSNMSLPILMNGRGIQYFIDSNNFTVRQIFDYSENGVANNISTTVSSTASITQLPTRDAAASAFRNCVWSHRVSSTQTLFKYTGLRPFLVTWDGVGDCSFIHPTNPSEVQLSDKADSFILPNGNLIVLGNRSDFTTVFVLVEYTPELTFVRRFDYGSFGSNLIGYSISVRRTSYGYVFGIVSVANGSAHCRVVTLNSSCTTVISTRGSRIQMNTPNTSLLQSVICGEDGVIFASWGNNGTLFGSVNMPVQSDGQIVLVDDQQFYPVESTSASTNNFIINSFVGVMPTKMGCNKFASAVAPTLFVDGSNSDNRSISFNSHQSTQGQRTLNYLDVNITPVISRNPISSFSTIFPAHVESTVNGVYFYTESNSSGNNMAIDENGFIWINFSGNSQTNRLFRRVPR